MSSVKRAAILSRPQYVNVLKHLVYLSKLEPWIVSPHLKGYKLYQT